MVRLLKPYFNIWYQVLVFPNWFALSSWQSSLSKINLMTLQVPPLTYSISNYATLLYIFLFMLTLLCQMSCPPTRWSNNIFISLAISNRCLKLIICILSQYNLVYLSLKRANTSSVTKPIYKTCVWLWPKGRICGQPHQMVTSQIMMKMSMVRVFHHRPLNW